MQRLQNTNELDNLKKVATMGFACAELSPARTAAPKKASKLAAANVDLSVNLRAIAVRAKLSEEVVWGVSVQQAQAALLPQNCSLSELVFFLNDSGALPKF